jgi:hypothetical protein
MPPLAPTWRTAGERTRALSRTNTHALMGGFCTTMVVFFTTGRGPTTQL